MKIEGGTSDVWDAVVGEYRERPRKYPVYPSAQATVEPKDYMRAIDALEGVPQVFCDGLTLLLPESEVAAIELLRTRFNATIEYGHGKEWEFVTKARAAGVAEELVRLGNAVQNATGLSADDMLRAALDEPDTTYANWAALYRASLGE